MKTQVHLSSVSNTEPIRTLAVWCPDWPITAAGFAPENPVVILHANRVVVCSSGARAEGIKRGMRKREAQARFPSVEIVNNDIDRDARTFELVVSAVAEFAPRVEVIRPGLCVVATRGPSRYFGGDIQLVGNVASRVLEALAESHGVCQVGVGDGPFAAQLAARQSTIIPPGETPKFLSSFPINVLENSELVDVLRRLGIKTLADFAALPAADVLARFGREGAHAHALAQGKDDSFFTGAPPPDDWSVQVELDPPEKRVDALAFVARNLASQLHERLHDSGMACTQIGIEAETENGESLLRIWRHDGTLNAQGIADRARWQLDGWVNGDVSMRPTSGVVLLRLVPERVVPANGKQVALWGGEQEADLRAARGFTRIQALIGHENVVTGVLRGARDVGDKAQWIPWGDVKEDITHTEQPWPGHIPFVVPPSVNSEPVPIKVVDEENNSVEVNAKALMSAKPKRVQINNSWHELRAWAGPWPVDERWWDHKTHKRRARLQVVTTDEQAYLLAIEGGQWWLEASFD